MTDEPSLIKLKVHPDSKAASVRKRADDSYELWVRAPAKDGRANAEALQLLAQTLDQDIRRLRIIRGATAPGKIVRLFPRAGAEGSER